MDGPGVPDADRRDARESQHDQPLATLPAFTVAPAADAHRRGPGVIVVHEGNGMSAQLLRFSERLADEGYRVIAPDFFSRSHDVDPTDFGAVIGSITPANLKGDFAAAADHAPGRRRDVDRRHRLLHGRVVHLPRRDVGRRPRGVAAVPFYGGGIARELGDPRARRSCSSAATTRTSRWPTSRRCRRTTHPTPGRRGHRVPRRRPRLHARRLGELRPRVGGRRVVTPARVLRRAPTLTSADLRVR